MTRHSQPFDDVTLDAQERFDRHLTRTYGTEHVVPEPNTEWVDRTRGSIPRTITVISVHTDARIPYAEVDDTAYGRGQTRLLAFGRYYQLKETDG